MRRFVLIIELVVLSAVGFAQLHTGFIRGTVHDGQSPRETTLRLLLRERTTGTSIAETTPAADGTFRLLNIPYGTYELSVVLDSVVLGERMVAVTSPIPVAVDFTALREYELRAETITAVVEQPSAHLASRSTMTTSSIEGLFAESASRKIERVILSAPGIVPDEDGRLHARGEDAQLQYIVDGIPITANLTRIYSSLFNSSTIKSLSLYTGALPAEFGVATAGVLAITTKSGFDKPLFAAGSISGGSFGTLDRTVQLGGVLGQSAAVYVAASAGETDRYLDPIADFVPLHDRGVWNAIFAKLNYLATDRVELVALAGYNETGFDIPNSMRRSPGQDQKQSLHDFTSGLRANFLLDESSFLSVVGYARTSTASTTSGGLNRILAPSDTAKAIRENEKFFVGSDRNNAVTGAQIELSTEISWLGLDHAIRTGVGLESYPLREYFSFAVTNPVLSDPAATGGDSRFAPYDLTRGGRPFLVDRSATGSRTSLYMQDQFSFGRWYFDAGLRYDAYSLLDDERALSPRINIGYEWSQDIILRASYNHLFLQAPVENILVSSSAEARQLSGSVQGATPTNVRSESADVLELGGFYRLNPFLDIDVAGYAKLIDNFIVRVELGNSGIIFPVNLKRGLAAGGEVTARLCGWKGFSGEVTLSTTTSLGLKPDDGTSPFAAGLILGEEGYFYTHPFAGEEMFSTEHHQLFTATLRVNYRIADPWSVQFGARFDSGLPFDLADSAGRGLDEAHSRLALRTRGYSDDVIDLLSLESGEPGSLDKSVAPHVVFDLGTDYRFTAFDLPVRATFAVMNLLDTKYLYRFESSFGGTHFGVPRTMALSLEVAY